MTWLLRLIAVLERLPLWSRLTLAVVLVTGAVAGLTIVAMTGSLPWIAGQLPASVALYGGAVWLVLPWFHSLAPHWRRRITTIPLVLYGLLVTGFALVAFTAAPEDKGGAGLTLVLVWLLHATYGTFEPKDFALERLRSRLVRAVYIRAISMALGVLGLLWYLHWLQSDPKFDVVLFGMAGTLVLATTAGILKVHQRFRKLTTLLNRHAQSLLRALEDLQEGGGEEERAKLRPAARRAWDPLRELLVTNVDTGFMSGTFVLPAASVRELEATVMAAVAASEGDATEFKAAVDALKAVQAACIGRIDPLV